MDLGENSRSELSLKCWPNVIIRGLRIIPKDETKQIYLFEMFHHAPEGFKANYISKIDIRGLDFAKEGLSFELSNVPISTSHVLKLRLRQKFWSHAKLLSTNIVSINN